MNEVTAENPLPMQLIIVTGLSGSGKSNALKVLEDLGFFCVDNLPPRFIHQFLNTCERWMPEVRRIGVTVDIRERAFLRDFPRCFYQLRERKKWTLEVLFLEASDEALVRRFSETRRPHPLAFSRPVMEGIREEKYQLQPIRSMAHRIIDTSTLSIHQLRRYLSQLYGEKATSGLILQFVSFGYRFGLPFHADIVFDARFLPNPFFEEHLKARTGLDPEVRKYVMSSPLARKFIKRISSMLQFLLPNYIEETKHYLTVAIGCTGGRHRSVALVESLARYWENRYPVVEVEHRDIDKI